MIILFHWAYMVAASLFTAILRRRSIKSDLTVTAQVTKDDDPIVGHNQDISGDTDAAKGGLLEQIIPLEQQSLTEESFPYESESCTDLDLTLRFVPPVYAQRYIAVQDILMDTRWEGNVKKVVDFGCAEFGFFQYLKNIPDVQEIVTVDIDEELLKKHCCRAAPFNTDYLSNREHPLNVKVYAGSIAKPDPRLLGTDAVVGIEIIEHLWPDEVEAVPHNVFGFIRPRLAIFTTPNSDFNVLFPNFSGFRHWDHKFEWSREQFHCWATNIVTRYPAYEVSFHGVGAGPDGTQQLGHCSQMALFVRRTPDCANTSSQQLEVVSVSELKLVCEYTYPYRRDARTSDEKIRDEAEYQLRFCAAYDKYMTDDGLVEIPVEQLLPFVAKWCTSLEHLMTVLAASGWEISRQHPDNPTVVYPYYDRHDSDQESDAHCDELATTEQDVNSRQSEDDWNEDSPSSIACYIPDEDDWNKYYPPGNAACDVLKEDDRNEGSKGNIPVEDIWGETSCDKAWRTIDAAKPANQPNGERHVSPKPLVTLDGCTRTTADVKQHSNMPDERTRDLGVSDESSLPLQRYVSNVSSESLKGRWWKDFEEGVEAEPSSAVNGERETPCDEVLPSVSGVQNAALKGVNWWEVEAVASGVNGWNSAVVASGVNGLKTARELTEALAGGSGVQNSTLAGVNGSDGSDESDDTCVAYDGTQAMDWAVSDHVGSGSDTDGSHDGVDNRVAMRRRPRQQHRNHIAFGLNAGVVENGDVANNNQDGEGNNLLEEDDLDLPDQLYVEIDMFEDEVGDHEDLDDGFDDDDIDGDDANGPLMPVGAIANPFPEWLLNLLELVENSGSELGGAGEPQWNAND